ncbi:MAG: hypothetical protein KDN22_32220 [Verrucomicrobiae bacterium]|nr:hypothetical protein [Verrucomicrobiae bacterium]
MNTFSPRPWSGVLRVARLAAIALPFACIPASLHASRSSANYSQPSEAFSSGVLRATSANYTTDSTVDIPWAGSSNAGAPHNYAVGIGHIPQLYWVPDLDGDGIPDPDDLDDDGDGWADDFELAVGSDPRNAASMPSETGNGDKDIWSNAFELLFGLDGGTFDIDCPVIFGTAAIGEDIHVTYTLTRKSDLSVLSSGLEVSFSSNPNTGFVAIAAKSSIEAGDGFQQDTFLDPVPVNDNGVITQRFGRIMVARQSAETYGTLPILITGDVDDTVTSATLTRFSVPVVGTMIGRGSVTSATVSTLTDDNAAFGTITPGKFYVAITSGVNEGAQATIARNTANQLTLDTDLSGLSVIGQTYEIRKHITIGSLFGDDNQTGLHEAGNSSDADDVLLTTPGGVETFFYSPAVPEGWKDSAVNDAVDEPIEQSIPVTVRRRVTGNLAIYPTGAVRRVPTRVSIAATGYTFIAMPNINPIPLADLGLDDLVTRGRNPVEGDNLLVFDHDGILTRYFYLDFGGTTGWYDSAFNLAGLIPAGATIIYQRKSGGAFEWNVPTSTPLPAP